MILYIFGILICVGAAFTQSTPSAILGIGFMIAAELGEISKHLKDRD